MNLGSKSLFSEQQAVRFGMVLTQRDRVGLFILTILTEGLETAQMVGWTPGKEQWVGQSPRLQNLQSGRTGCQSAIAVGYGCCEPGRGGSGEPHAARVVGKMWGQGLVR